MQIYGKTMMLLVASSALSLLTATILPAQQLPGAGPEPDYAQVFRHVPQYQPSDGGPMPDFNVSSSSQAQVGSTGQCTSPTVKEIVASSLYSNSSSQMDSNQRVEEGRIAGIQVILDNLGPDISAEANNLKRLYAQLPSQAQLGSFELCTVPAHIPRFGISFKMALFDDNGNISGGFVATKISGQPYVAATFGGLSRERYEQLSQAMSAIAAKPVTITGDAGSSYCARADIRRQAAQAVNDKILLQLGIGEPKDVLAQFNQLAIDYSERAAALKRSMLNSDPKISEIQICSPPNQDIPGWLTTVVIREGSRMGGFVMNFGAGNQIAPFGNLPQSELRQ